MPTYDETQAACHVFTFKEGALSALAHDLEIQVGKLAIVVAADLSLDATFDARTLVVLHAIKNGHPSDALSDGDKRKIEKTIVDDVLDARKFPEIRFRAPAPTRAGDGFAYAGQLSLHGKTHTVELRSRAEGTNQVAEVLLHQPDYGIKPYSAMLGALKIKPDVKLRITLPAPAAG